VNQKARLVARGFLQKEGFDYTEVFSPIAKHETNRLVIVVTTSKVWPMYHLYVKSSFLNGTVEGIVYVFTGVFGKQYKMVNNICVYCILSNFKASKFFHGKSNISSKFL